MQTNEVFRTTSVDSHADRLMACSIRQMQPTPFMQIHVFQATTLVGGAIALDRQQVKALCAYLIRWVAEGWSDI